MKVVFDTNVVISAAIKDRIPEKVILFVVGNPDFQWVASPEIIEEYMSVLHRPKFNLPDSIIDKWKQIFETLITIYEVTKTYNFPRDQKDARFLACSLAAGADYFITGDRDFEDAYKIGNTKRLSVRLFNKYVCNVW